MKEYQLTDEQQQLVAALMRQYPNPLALVCVTKIRGACIGRGAVFWAKEYGFDDEDIQQTAWEGAIAAARNFDSSRGADFSTYAAARMVSHVQRLSEKNKPGSKRYPAEGITSLQDSQDHEYEHQHQDYRRNGNERSNPAFELWESDEFRLLRSNLDIRERLTLYLRTVESYTLRDVAAVFGISKERARQVEYGARAKIRRRAQS